MDAPPSPSEGIEWRSALGDPKRAEEHLAELVDEVSHPKAVVLNMQRRAVARVVPTPEQNGARCFGSAQGKAAVHLDFSAPLAEFREYA